MSCGKSCCEKLERPGRQRRLESKKRRFCTNFLQHLATNFRFGGETGQDRPTVDDESSQFLLALALAQVPACRILSGQKEQGGLGMSLAGFDSASEAQQ